MDSAASDASTSKAGPSTAAWKVGLVIVVVLLAACAVLRVLFAVRRRRALDSLPPSPASSTSHRFMPTPSRTRPAPPPSYTRTTPTHAQTRTPSLSRSRNPASRCLASVAVFFRPFSSTFAAEDGLREADPATLERRRRQNLAIQQALIDAGLMLPPIRSGARNNTAESGYEGGGAAVVEGTEPTGKRARFWRWLSASGAEPDPLAHLEGGSRVLDTDLHRSPTELHSSSFALASLERDEERAARRARRQRRQEHAAAVREEECISLGLPAYTREKGEHEQSLMRVGVDARADDGAGVSDSEDGGLEVVARPERAARPARARAGTIERRV